ncbi:hypothetical protein INT47_013036 [Mucor saturninus]|uniref:Uncharacterized protein n=1 Tax=Mucor saturninus TaxID=64648 RepID=A0A8H7R0D9_9FUNG|nr:hypothetical protein INT47_013036 [Mucor saturninus]
MSPSFAQQVFDTECYLYESIPDVTIVSKDPPSLHFNYYGIYYTEAQAIHIQFYKPNKNPNRVVFSNENILSYDVYAVDKWIDRELYSGSENDVISQIISVYPDYELSIQFDTVHTKKLDPDSWLNLVGIFPKYLDTSELSITHSGTVDRRTYEDYLDPVPMGKEVISTASFNVKTIIEQRDVTIVSAFGVMGGIVGILLTAYAFLFGAKPKEPWGIFQNVDIFSNSKRKQQQNLEKYFLIPNTQCVPFVTPVHERFLYIYNLNRSNHNVNNPDLLEESELLSNNIELESISYGVEVGKEHDSRHTCSTHHKGLEERLG